MMELDAIFAVTVVGGTSLTGGRFTLVGSIVTGALLIQTLTTSMYNFRRAAGGDARAEGRRDRCGVPDAIGKFRSALRGLFGRRAAA